MCREQNELFVTVLTRGILHANQSTFSAGLSQAIGPARNKDARWFHRTTAEGGAIARVFINMFTPQTVRTMIGVSIARYTRAAVLAGEVLGGAGETPLQIL